MSQKPSQGQVRRTPASAVRPGRQEEEREEERRRLAEQARRERERLAGLERARVSAFESLAGLWGKARRLGASLDAVKDEALRRQVATEGEDGFARWLEWAERHAQAIDPLAEDGPRPTYRGRGGRARGRFAGRFQASVKVRSRSWTGPGPIRVAKLSSSRAISPRS